MADLSIEQVTDIEQFCSLREPWNALLQKSHDKNVFLTWEWLFTWWQHYGNGKELRIFVIREADRIIGIAPLMQTKYGQGIINIDVIENLCAVNCDYSGIILTERRHESVAVLLGYLEKLIRDNNVIVRMSHIPEKSSFVSALREQYPAFSKSLSLNERLISSCPYITLPATWEEYFQTLSRNRRGILRRAMRSLQKDHTVEFKKYENNESLQDKLQVLFDFHKERWQKRNISSKFSRPEAREFYVDVSQAFYQSNLLNLSYLNIDGETVSIIWGFNYDGKYYYMTPAFNLSYSDYGVGNVHMMKLIEDAIHIGLSEFDFLKGTEAHKSHWTHCKIDNIQIIMAKRCFWGRYRLKLLEMLIKYEHIRARSLRDNFIQLYKKIQGDKED